MNAFKFDELVKARANERVQERIKKFREDIINAVKTLRPEFKHHSLTVRSDMVKGLFACLPENTGWPAEIWRDEEECVSKELLATLDEMQKAFISIGKIIPDEVSPAEKE